MHRAACCGTPCVTRASSQSSELFALTYGALVTQVGPRRAAPLATAPSRRVPQLLKDFEDVDAVNAKLEQM